MMYMVTELCAPYSDMPLPVIHSPTLLAFVSPSRGFGVFAASDIRKDLDKAAPMDQPLSPLCVATYAGVVCTDKEVKKPNYAYRMPFGSLPSHLGRQTVEYVP